MQGHKITDQMLETVRVRRAKGENMKIMAKEFGVHPTSLYQRLRGVKKTAAPKYRGSYKVKASKVATIPLNTAPTNQVDRVVVLLVAPNQLSKVIGELNANR